MAYEANGRAELLIHSIFSSSQLLCRYRHRQAQELLAFEEVSVESNGVVFTGGYLQSNDYPGTSLHKLLGREKIT